MRKRNHAMRTIIATSSLVLGLASCGNNGDFAPETGPSGSEVHFSATIDGVATRAYDRTWEANDQIGISGTNYDVTYTNVPYITAGGDGTFTAVGDVIYYQTYAGAEYFTAYYPWNDLQSGATTISADTRKQANQKAFDFLWASGSGDKTSPNVAFTFVHKMAKVVLTIKPGAGVSYDEVKAAMASLGGYMDEGTFDVTTGETATTGKAATLNTFAGNLDKYKDQDAPYTTDDKAGTVSYTLIVFPQTFTEPLSFMAEILGKQYFMADLDFTNANKEADGEEAKNEWKAGRQYNLGIVLNKTSITVEGCTIAAWQETNGGDVSAY